MEEEWGGEGGMVGNIGVTGPCEGLPAILCLPGRSKVQQSVRVICHIYLLDCPFLIALKHKKIQTLKIKVYFSKTPIFCSFILIFAKWDFAETWGSCVVISPSRRFI